MLNRQQYTVETLWKENEQLKKENKELKELVCEVDNELEIRDIVCGAGKFRLEEWGKHRYHQFYKGDEELEDETVVIMLMELEKENKELQKENEQLTRQLQIFEKFLEGNDLSIDWEEFCGLEECAFENPNFSCKTCIHLKGDV